MKRTYLLSLLIFIALFILLVIFHNQIINLSLPLIKDRIQTQLNILDHEETKISIKTDIENKSLVLNILNPYFKESEHLIDSYASSIIVEKKVRNLFNKKISRIIIDKLNIKIVGEKIYLDAESEFSLDDEISNLLQNIENFNQILIKNSNFNLFSIIDNHELYVEELNIDNINNLVRSTGIIKNDNSNNPFKISTSDNELLNMEISLDLYPLMYLENTAVNKRMGMIINNKYSGKINLLIDPEFKFFKSEYKISSIDNRIRAIGKYSSKNNAHDSSIEINDINLDNFISDSNVFKYIDISQLGKSNIKFKIINSFNNIDFYITGTNIDYIATGKIKNNLIYNLKININEISLENYIFSSELSEIIDITALGPLNIEIISFENFNNINFQINNTKNNFDMSGLFKNNQLYELNASGKDIKIYKFIKNNKLNDAGQNWIINSLVVDNNFSFDLKYKFSEKVFDIRIVDIYDNIINTNFDLSDNSFNNFEIIFFNDDLNKFQWNKKDLSFIVSFNQKLRKFIINNFDIDIFEEMRFSYIRDFDKINFKGNVPDDYLDKLINSTGISSIVNNYSIHIENVQLNTSRINFINNFVKNRGSMDIFYEKNNISDSGKVKINLAQTEIDIKNIKFSKAIDIPLELHFNYKNDLNDELIVTDLLVKGNDINITGEITLLDNIVKSANFDTFKILDNDFNVRINSKVASNSKFNRKFNVNIGGKKMDLSFLKVNETKSFLKGIPIKISMNLKKLKYINNTDFNPVELRGDFYNVWQSLYFKGLFDSGEDLNISLKNSGEGRIFNINSSNAGKALMIKKISKSIRGGSLKFSGRYESNENDNFFNANLSLKNFAIKKKSKLATFIKVIRIFDIKKQLDGDTEDFEYAEIKIKKKEKIYEITDAKAYGGLMALSANGSVNKNNDKVDIKGLVAPTYALDSWVGQIPLFGTLLTGIEGGGVIAANYSVKGMVDDPKYFVNPLSMLTPGIFKEFWSVFELQKSQDIN